MTYVFHYIQWLCLQTQQGNGVARVLTAEAVEGWALELLDSDFEGGFGVGWQLQSGAAQDNV